MSTPPKAQALKGIFAYFKPLSCHKAFENTESGTSNLSFEDKVCEVEDVRGREGGFGLGLDGNGFCWVRHETKLNFEEMRDGKGNEGAYLREVEDLVRDVLGAGDGDGSGGRRNKRVVRVFDWKLRNSGDAKNGVSLHPHVDQTPSGAIRRVKFHFPSEADELLKGRFRLLNIWRPLKQVTSYPLAVCDPNSVSPQDLIPKERIRKKYTGESFLASYSESHRWYFLGGQREDEVLVMKIFDSEEGGGARFCLHSSFELDRSDGKKWEGVRESIEVRVMVFDSPLKDDIGKMI